MNGAALSLALVTLVLWSCTPSLMLALVGQPPARIVGITFLLGALIGLPHVRRWRVPWRTFLLCAGTFAAYRLILMVAFELAPSVETSLLNGLHPLLIVLLPPLVLAGYTMRAWHVIGAALGFAGAALAVTRGHLDFDAEYAPGYALALASAVMWAVYSLLLKRLPPFPSMANGGFMLAAGMLALALDALESTWRAPAPPLDATAWMALIALGLGPTGIAYTTWDAAMKRGDPRLVGSVMYLSPILAIALMAGFNGQRLSWDVVVGGSLLVVGAVVGAWPTLREAWRTRQRDGATG